MLSIKNCAMKTTRVFQLCFFLPHYWVLIVTCVLAVSTCILSINLRRSDPYTSSLLSNLFAGLVTGVTLSLLSAVKARSLYKTERTISWLNELHKLWKEYNNKYNELLSNPAKQESDDRAERFYEVLCAGSSIDIFISQGQFSRELPFNPCRYCKLEFEYDASIYLSENDDLRDQILYKPLPLSNNETRKLFCRVDQRLNKLNSNVLSKIRTLEAKKKAISISIP